MEYSSPISESERRWWTWMNPSPTSPYAFSKVEAANETVGTIVSNAPATRFRIPLVSMEIKAKRGDLLAALYWAQNIVERRNTMPILANALIDAQKNKILLAATDLEVGVRGAFTETRETAPSTNGASLTISSGSATIRSPFAAMNNSDSRSYTCNISPMGPMTETLSEPIPEVVPCEPLYGRLSVSLTAHCRVFPASFELATADIVRWLTIIPFVDELTEKARHLVWC